jgi:hypothetical protein
MGVYLIFYLKISGLTEVFGNSITNTKPNAQFVLLFSIFAEMFTSTIEEWIYKKIRKILALDKDNQNENSKYNIEASDFYKLGLNEDLIYRLYYEANIANTLSLANSDAKNISDKLKLDTRKKKFNIM